MTELPSLRPVRLSGWRGRDDLIGAALASAHIPLLLDGSFAVRVLIISRLGRRAWAEGFASR